MVRKSRSKKFVTNFCVFLFQNTINRTHAYERVCSNRGYQLVILRLCWDWVGILSKCTMGMFWRPHRFHMTSRPPYWCSRQNNETAAMLVSQINPESWTFFLCKKISFVAINVRSCWPREWKRSIGYPEVAREMESKFLPQNSIIVQRDRAPT